jgi:hypothetical protein
MNFIILFVFISLKDLRQAIKVDVDKKASDHSDDCKHTNQADDYFSALGRRATI